MLEIGAALEISTAGELRQAARDGRLREVPGHRAEAGGADRRRARAGAARRRARDPAAARPRADRGDRRGARRARRPATRGAGSTSRRAWPWSSTSDDPAAARERFAALPEIVALLDADTGITADGIPIELVVAPPDALGTALVRATGPAEHLDALGPLPSRPTRRASTRSLGLAVPPPEIRDGTLEQAPPQLVELARAARRPARAHAVVGRPRDGARDGHRRPRPRLRVPRDLRPHAERERRPGPGRRRACAGRARRSPPPTSAWRRSGSCAASSATSATTAASTHPTTCWPSSTGSSSRSTAGSARRAGS